ncbi:MAG: hypothetical protein HETSPECPRED_001323 [Heterodermia speciosa]|uniref:Uncharacterized protein n=1 Tax=Heterodermia speciosa TaxID=116794 RepID=A0A8H3ETC2_9LECA|nr:MAG: hypothetical protein HETSPECPRED_001323 [Heterodermia speciosa]
MHLQTVATVLVPALLVSSVPLSTANPTPDNSTLSLAANEALVQRQSSSNFQPATPACPPACPAGVYMSSGSAEQGRVPATVAGMCVAVGVAGIVGGLGLGMEDEGKKGEETENQGEREGEGK